MIVARAGNDVVRSRGGVDFVCGGPGDDRISGGPNPQTGYQAMTTSTRPRGDRLVRRRGQ